MKRNEDGTVEFEFDGDRFTLRPNDLPAAVGKNGENILFTAYISLLGVPECRTLLVEAILELDFDHEDDLDALLKRYV